MQHTKGEKGNLPTCSGLRRWMTCAHLVGGWGKSTYLFRAEEMDDLGTHDATDGGWGQGDLIRELPKPGLQRLHLF